MLKNILKLEGAESLTRKELMNVIGADGSNRRDDGRLGPRTTCIDPVIICENGIVYDPCVPINSGGNGCNP